MLAKSPMKGAYDEAIDRESAYEVLRGRAEAAQANAPEKASTRGGPAKRTWGAPSPRPPAQPRASNRQTMAEAAAKSAARSVASSLGRALVRGILGSLLKR